MARTGSARLIQVLLLVGIVAALVRLGSVLSERAKTAPQPQAAVARPGLQPEYYVTPKRLYLYDLKAAQQLTQQPVWIKEGYRYTYYPYDASSRRADFQHEAGTLGPIEKLQIKAVTTQPTPGAPGQRQILASFEKDGKNYAVPVGAERAGDFHIYADEMLFYQDPRDLYKFWPQAVWDAIASHQVTNGMNEFQVAFAVGMGIPQASGADNVKIVKYPNGGHPLTVTFENGRVADVHKGTQAGPA